MIKRINTSNLENLIDILGIKDKNLINWELLAQAFTHPSIAVTRNSYDELEFIGDAVLRLAATQFLKKRYPNSTVGEWTAIRKMLVSDRILIRIAKHFQIDSFLRVGDSERQSNSSRLADTLETLIGALYLSTNSLELIQPWLETQLNEIAEEIRLDPAHQNYKDALQEWTQAHYKCLPKYCLSETRPIHGDPDRFTAEVWLNEQKLGIGTGPSKKAAQQSAAKQAFLKLN